MKNDKLIYILMALGLLFVIIFGVNLALEKSYKENIQNFEQYTQKATKLINLQNKWKNKKTQKKLLKKIKSRFKPTSDEVVKGVHTLSFKNLSENNLNRLGKMLLNSNLIIKKINLKKDNDKTSLHVEVKI